MHMQEDHFSRPVSTLSYKLHWVQSAESVYFFSNVLYIRVAALMLILVEI